MTSAELHASAAGAKHPITAARGATAPTARLSAAEVLTAGLGLALLCVVLSYLMGRDLNWDFFNYHGYAAVDIFGQRLSQDFFPAGVQGYLNRLPYLPFALMDGAGWHSAATAAGMASLQSLNLLFLYLIARDLTAQAQRPRLVAAVLTLLGAASNVYLLQVGSTFVDPMTTPPVMAAVWLLMRRGEPRTLLLAGALCGAAAALKLTNAPYAAGLFAAAMVAQPRGGRGVLRALLAAGAGTAAGFLLLYAHWGWQLWELHGSPMFPLFNNIFRSTDYPLQAVAYQRFVPRSLADVFWLPFAMIEHRSWIYAEGVSPDLRPALVLVLSMVGGMAAGWRVWRHRVAGHPAPARPAPDASVRRLAAFFVVAALGWLLTSANGRYAVPLLLLLGPMLFVAGASVFGSRLAAVVCLAVLPLQILLLYDAGNPRWAPTDWTRTWLPASVPDELKSQPFLYLSASTSSEAYVAAHVHPDSVFVNPIGLAPIANDGPGWTRFVSLRDRWAGQTKVLFALPAVGDPELKAQRVATLNGAVDRLGLAMDTERCDVLRFDEPTVDVLPHLWRRDDSAPRGERQLLACDAKIAAPSARMAALRAQASEILDAYERKCPTFFAPNQVQIEGNGRVWSRLYGKYDLFVVLEFETGAITYRMERQATEVGIGNVKTWQSDVARFRCHLPHDGARDLSTLAGDAGR